jgi:hypothetical protein
LKNLSIEHIFLLIIFILLPLLNMAVHRMQRRREGQPPEPRSMPELRRRAQESPPRSPAPQTSGDGLHGRESPPGPTLLPRRRFTKRSLFRTRADVRRAIILMTILGPCRAFKPEE